MTEHEPHPTKTDCSPALQDRPTATSPIARPPLHPGTGPPTLRKTTTKIKTETSKQLAEPSSQAEAKLTPQEVRQLHHPRSKILNQSLGTLSPSPLDGYSPLQPNNLLLSILQSQANGLVGTLTSVILQRIPRTKNAQSGLPQDKQNKGIKKQQEEQPSSHSDKDSQRSTVTTKSRITDTVLKATLLPPPSPTTGGS